MEINNLDQKKDYKLKHNATIINNLQFPIYFFTDKVNIIDAKNSKNFDIKYGKFTNWIISEQTINNSFILDLKYIYVILFLFILIF